MEKLVESKVSDINYYRENLILKKYLLIMTTINIKEECWSDEQFNNSDTKYISTNILGEFDTYEEAVEKINTYKRYYSSSTNMKFYIASPEEINIRW